MKRIFLSVSMLALVGSIAAIGSTGAFFTDSETSTGNIFTAGSIDLKIDHSLSTYNDSSDMTIVTDPSWTFVGNNGISTPASGNALDLTFVHPNWETITGANWIWATDPVSDPANPTTDQSYTFTKTFNWSGPISGASIDWGADNYYDVYVNNTLIGSNHVLTADNFQLPHTTNVTGLIVQGVNTIKFVGENQHIDNSDFNGNPAGIDLKLVIHGQQTFGPTDLTNQTFWDFSDVKPQDHGRDIISMHVTTNDAWSCMIIKNIQNNENTLIAPESAAGDVTPGVPPGTGGGELGAVLHLFLWHDLNADGNFNPSGGETPITPTPINLAGPGPIILPVHDSTTLPAGPMLANIEDDVGSAWCAGTLAVDGSGSITCDGSSVNNQSQTDSTLADLEFYATQARNQPGFQCSSLGCSFNADTNLVTDGGFETPVVATPQLWDIFPSPVGGWIVDWTAADAITFGSQTRPATANLELHRGVLGPASEGQQYAELDTDWGGPSDSGTGEPASVSIHQSIPTQAGAHYNLHFAFSPRPNTTADENHLEVKWNGAVVYDSGPVAGLGANTWTPHDIDVVGTGAPIELRFTDLGTADSQGTFLDDVQVKQTSCVNPII